MNYILNNRFVKFIFVGILNTIVGYGTYALLIFFGFNYIISSTVSTIVGVINSFILNKKITFSDKGINKKTPFKFISVYLFSYFIGLFNLSIFIKKLGFNPYLAGFINLFITTLISWFGHRYFSFNDNE